MSPQTTETKPIASGQNQTLEPKEKVFTTTAQPGSATRTKDILAIMVTALPIIGALGTFFVWTMTNFYVGDVEVQTSRPYSAITVKVFDTKGQEVTFHTPKFQLMPGNYHLEIVADNNGIQHADTNVAFHAKTNVQVELPSDLDSAAANEVAPKRKYFFQFWKKK